MKKYNEDILRWRQLLEDMEEDETEEEDEEEEEEEEESKPKKNGKGCKESDVVEFLKSNPNPSDDDVHDWAEENGFDVDKLESIFYKLATKYVQSMDKKEEK